MTKDHDALKQAFEAMDLVERANEESAKAQRAVTAAEDRLLAATGWRKDKTAGTASTWFNERIGEESSISQQAAVSKTLKALGLARALSGGPR